MSQNEPGTFGQIDDQQLIVGTLVELDALGLPAGDSIISAVWSTTDTSDAGTDVTVVSGDASSGTSDGDLSKFTIQATGTGEGTVAVNGVIGTASGASLLYNVTGSVNGGPATSISADFGAPQPIPAG